MAGGTVWRRQISTPVSIDGDTILTTVEALADVLPAAARIRIGDAEVIVTDYELWKRLVRGRQAK